LIRSAVAEEEAGTHGKPLTQLDHGTGELVSFVEVRKDTSPTDRTTPAEEEPAPSVPRRTVADLERAEAQALERRRAGRSGAQAFAEEPTAPARDPRQNKSLADLGRSDGGTGAAEGTTDKSTDKTTDEA